MDEFRPLTGEALREAVRNRPPTATPIAEDFLYERRVMMISADPGVGKSTVIGQAALALTKPENKLFRYLEVPRPRNVYYMQLEGSMDETLERIGYMAHEISVDYDRLYWDPVPVLNCCDAQSVNETLQRMQVWDRRPDVVIIDPIYMAVTGDLKKGEISTALVRFSERLKRTFGCAVILVHHTHRTQYTKEGRRVKESDPYYGSQWLKAHVDVSYHLSSPDGTENGAKVELTCKKMRGGDVKRHIVLTYDHETFTNYIDLDRANFSGEELLLNHLEACRRENRDTNFQEALNATQVSPSQLRRIQRELKDRGILRVLSLNGRSKVWRLAELT